MGRGCSQAGGWAVREETGTSTQKAEKNPWAPPTPPPSLWAQGQAGRQAGGRAGGPAGKDAEVSTCGGFHLSPAATTAAAAGSDPPPCWPLTCCRQEGDAVTDSHKTTHPGPLSPSLAKG